MAGDWRDVTLDEISEDITVGHVGLMADQYVDNGVPFLRSLNVDHFGISTNDLKYISREFHGKLRKSALKPGDVVIVRTGKPGACAVIPDWLVEANCSDLVIVRADRQVRPAYISYVVNSTACDHISAYTVGAVQQHFNVGSARTIRFKIPSLVEQDRILQLLGGLDDKIKVNRRMAETLEGMARAIFKSWFVDFDSVRAKTEGRPTNLPDDLAALFPDRFGEDGLPAGWDEKPLTEFLSIIGGGTPKTSIPEYWNGAIPWFSVTDTPLAGSVFVVETEKTITEKGIHESSARLVPKGTTIISARETIGNLAIAGQDMTFNQSCYALCGNGAVGEFFTYLATQHMVGQLQSKAHGSVFSTITRQTFESVSLPKPDDDVLREFEVATAPLFDRILTSVRESYTLAALRDTLLPKLISGELRIADAEQRIAAA